MPEPLAHRYDFAYFFDVTDGNPNGDPDAGNLPRLDPETGHGLVTDVCLKRKIRNFVQLVHEGEPPFEIYVKEKAILNKQHERAYKALDPTDPKKRKKGEDKAEKDRELTAWMCQNFYDIRTFGAVMTTGVNCGQVRGPVQLGIARSLEPIVPAEHAVTRCAVTTEKEAIAQDGDNRTMGRKFTVPYALYRVHGFVNAPLAQQTGFSEDDLDLLKRASTRCSSTTAPPPAGRWPPGPASPSATSTASATPGPTSSSPGWRRSGRTRRGRARPPVR